MNIPSDLKNWCVLSCPTDSLRFDKRTLELLDTDKNGLVRTDEVLAALAFLESKGVKASDLEQEDPEAPARLAAAANEDEERLWRYRIHLGEFLRNYVDMSALNGAVDRAIFLPGVLRLAGREMHLCFEVADEEAHSALVGKSNCFVLYLKLRRAGVEQERGLCAAVTAGHTRSLYVGRNGVFYDRDGTIWQAVVTRVVENQVSLAEAFWAPWRKLGETVTGLAKKAIGDRNDKATAKLMSTAESPNPAQNGGAAMASSVAAIGIGVGMVGAALASVMAAVRGMTPAQWGIALAAAILVVSLPSVVIAYLKLRKRDLGAILNASGWAVNGELRLSMSSARRFTLCHKRSLV